MSDTTITGAGVGLPSASYVTPDGRTILGAGTTEIPLTTDGGQSTFGTESQSIQFALPQGFLSGEAMPIGAPVYPAVASAGYTEVYQAQANALSTSGVLGLLTASVAGAGLPVEIVTGGLFTMTTAQWDAVVQGESGGLVVGDFYYLNWNSPSAKPIVNGPPTSGSNYLVGLGVAISPTTMLVRVGEAFNVQTP